LRPLVCSGASVPIRGPLRYLSFLRGVHDALQPPTYLEIGVRHGDSLALSRAASIGVDPSFSIRAEIDARLTLRRTTSDEFFADPDALAPFRGVAPALSFIDGMHLLENALRDFVNVERRSRWWSVVVFDDVCPRSVQEAARDRHTTAWTGDLFKVPALLRAERPDLVCLTVDTEPTGLLLVLGLDPASDAIGSRYDALLDSWVTPDPQPVPADVLARAGALDPQQVLDAPFWGVLREARASGAPREEGLAALRRSLDASFAASV
jgi:hypothetical protein